MSLSRKIECLLVGVSNPLALPHASEAGNLSRCLQKLNSNSAHNTFVVCLKICYVLENHLQTGIAKYLYRYRADKGSWDSVGELDNQVLPTGETVAGCCRRVVSTRPPSSPLLPNWRSGLSTCALMNTKINISPLKSCWCETCS